MVTRNSSITSMVFSILAVILILIPASLHAVAVRNRPRLNNSGLNPPETLLAPRTILDYMLQLRKDLADSNGKPKLANIEDPTEVWALQDSDILQGRYRRKPSSEEQCKSTHQLFFNLESMVLAHMKKQLPVEKSILRTYIEFNSRLLEAQGPTVVTIEVYMKLLERNNSESVLAGVYSVPVTAQFSQWVEINVTDGITVFGPPTAEDKDLEVTLILKIDCQLNMRVPAFIVNPATIPLGKANRREKKLLFQPYLVVHLSDETIKDIVRNESIGTSNEGALGVVSINKENTTNNETRKKRYISTSGCHREDFFADLSLIEIRYIQAPIGYNARLCRGICDDDFLSPNEQFGNNHSRIMAKYRKMYDSSVSSVHDQFTNEPKGPCCVPVSYSSITVIEMNMELKYAVYPGMVVEACGCR